MKRRRTRQGRAGEKDSRTRRHFLEQFEARVSPGSLLIPLGLIGANQLRASHLLQSNGESGERTHRLRQRTKASLTRTPVHRSDIDLAGAASTPTANHSGLRDSEHEGSRSTLANASTNFLRSPATLAFAFDVGSPFDQEMPLGTQPTRVTSSISPGDASLTQELPTLSPGPTEGAGNGSSVAKQDSTFDSDSQPAPMMPPGAQTVANTNGAALSESESAIAEPAAADSSVEAMAADAANATNVSLGFESGLLDWDVEETGGTSLGAGSVIDDNGTALLREGDSFLVTLERSFVIPATTATLEFTYTDLSFDQNAGQRINDAFEVALTDAEGQTVVHSCCAT